MKGLLVCLVAFVAVHAAPLPDDFNAKIYCEEVADLEAKNFPQMYAIADVCEKYVMCWPTDNGVLGWKFDCPSGTYFSLEKRLCDHTPAGSPCSNSPVELEIGQCINGVDIYTKNGPNKYTMDVGGVKTALVCTEKYDYFNVDTCKCENDVLALNECILEIDVDTIYQTDGDAAYRRIDRTTRKVETMYCPVRFSVFECGCVDTPVQEGETECNQYDMEGSANAPSYMAENQATVEAGKAIFDGTPGSFIRIPYYASNELGDQVTIAVEFEHLVSGVTEYIPILTNRQVEIAVTTDSIRASINTICPADQACVARVCSMESAFPMSMAMFPFHRAAIITYDGENIHMSVNGVELGSAPCTGEVKETSRPFFLGQGFNGYIHNLYICKGVAEFVYV